MPGAIICPLVFQPWGPPPLPLWTRGKQNKQGRNMSQTKSSFDLSRRQFMAGAAGLGITTLASGLIVPSAFAQEATPKRGGVLKLGIGGGSTTDNFDIRVLNDWVPVNQAYMVFNGLVEIDKDNMVQPE